MNNKTVVFDAQFEIRLLREQVAALWQEIATLKQRGTPYTPYGPLFGPNQSPPFCPPTDLNWWKTYSTCENKDNNEQ